MLNKVKFTVCGKEYNLQTEEAPSYVYNLAKHLEKRITSLTASNASVSPYSAAIMVALSTLDDLSKANTSIENIRAQAKAYVDEAGKARIERDNAIKEVQQLRLQLEQLTKEEKPIKKTKEAK